MKTPTFKFGLLFLLTIIMSTGCMVLDGSNGHRKGNKCCGIIKCDLHRRSQVKKHKRSVNAHKSLKKKEQRIKRGY